MSLLHQDVFEPYYARAREDFIKRSPRKISDKRIEYDHALRRSAKARISDGRDQSLILEDGDAAAR